jgi:hypothetical protein
MSTKKLSLDVIYNDIAYIKDDVREIKEKMNADYITREEFEPIKKLVYGTIGLVLTAVAIAVINLVINK